MKQFHKASLMHFQPKCKEHIEAVSAIDNYPFYTNLYLITEFLKSTDFPGGVDINEQDYKKYIVEDNFLVGIDLINDELDEYKYLFDAFNVYFCQEGSSYYTQDPTLTNAWRKVINNFYPNSTYCSDVKKLLRKELKENISAAVANYDEQIESL